MAFKLDNKKKWIADYGKDGSGDHTCINHIYIDRMTNLHSASHYLFPPAPVISVRYDPPGCNESRGVMGLR